MSSRAPSTKLIVELAGAPGSGKTSIGVAVEAGCRMAGLQPMWSAASGRVLAFRTPLGRFVPSRLGGPLTRLQRLRSAIAHLALHPSLVWIVGRAQLRRPAGAMVRERGVVRWFVANVGVTTLFRRWSRPGEILLVEEGYAHRVVQLFTSPVESADAEVVERYFDAIPRPDLLVFVRADVTSCLERVKSRGVWDRLAHLSDEELEAFVRHAHAASEFALQAACSRGWDVVEVDNVGDPDETRRAVADLIAVRLNSRERGWEEWAT